MTESPEAAVATSPGLTALAAFAGEWTMELRWSEESHKLIGGPASVRTLVRFEWIENGCFLVQRMGENSAPDARWVIGVDDSSGAFSVLYAESCGTRPVAEIGAFELRHRRRKSHAYIQKAV